VRIVACYLQKARDSFNRGGLCSRMASSLITVLFTMLEKHRHTVFTLRGEPFSVALNRPQPLGHHPIRSKAAYSSCQSADLRSGRLFLS
jgi:hypothetical protein